MTTLMILLLTMVRPMGDIVITDTKISGKKDDIMYVVFNTPTKVMDVRHRIADCQNPEIKTRDYIPPIIFDRYSALGRHASDLRDNDIALFTKQKGTDDPLEVVDMEELRKKVHLPAIDYSVKWGKKQDRQSWRRTSPSTGKVVLKSLGDRTASPSRGIT